MDACLSPLGTGFHEGAGFLHRIEVDLEDLHDQHILQEVTLPSVRMLYPDVIIHLQQEHSTNLDTRVVHESVARQADVEIIDWPLREPDMNPVGKCGVG